MWEEVTRNSNRGESCYVWLVERKGGFPPRLLLFVRSVFFSLLTSLCVRDALTKKVLFFLLADQWTLQPVRVVSAENTELHLAPSSNYLLFPPPISRLKTISAQVWLPTCNALRTNRC